MTSTRGWRARPSDEIRDLATAFRIPNAPVANGANIVGLDHFEERGSFVSNPRDGFDQPGHPYRTTPAVLRAPEPAPRLGEHTEHYRRNGHIRVVKPPPQQPEIPFRRGSCRSAGCVCSI